ncbi:MAG: hypothetical protein ACI4DK_05350 [Lachnospiraceae bacterium]
MILKEIEMDLPYVRDDNQENLSDDAIKLDYELNWKEKRRQIQLMTRCMTSMIERIIPRITTKDCWKILIECVEKPLRKEGINLLGVYSVQVFFEINKFLAMNSLEKKQYVVNKIREGISKLSQYNSFDVEEIQKACNKIVDSNYVNEWFWNKPVKSKQVSVQIKVLHEVESVSIYMVFKDSIKNVYEEKFLVEDIPDERVYSKYLGKLEWISVRTARLSTKNGEYFVETYE